MPKYDELKQGSYYLVRHDKDTDIELVQILMETENTLLLRSFLPEEEDFFMHKNAEFFELTEELDEITMTHFFSIYNDEDDDDETPTEYFDAKLFDDDNFEEDDAEEDDFEGDEYTAEEPGTNAQEEVK